MTVRMALFPLREPQVLVCTLVLHLFFLGVNAESMDGEGLGKSIYRGTSVVVAEGTIGLH